MAHEKKYGTVIAWLRRDLRVADNQTLFHACELAERVIPLFVLDKAVLERPDTGPARVLFLLDALAALDLRLRHSGGRLIVRQGRTPEALIEIAQELHAEAVFFHREYEPFGKERDSHVCRGLTEIGIATETFNNLMAFEPNEITSQAGSPYTVYTPYKRVWFAQDMEPPCPIPEKIIVPPDVSGLPLPIAPDTVRVICDQEFARGGEETASALLRDFIDTKIRTYDEDRDLPACEGTSRLSRHLHFGTISPRTIIAEVRAGQKNADFRTVTSGNVFLSEIAWRDFYLQILDQFPHVAAGAFRPVYDAISWENNDDWIAAWKAGQTGYPIVDAAMRQMNAEAWMHNRCRMIVASFLTKDLLIDWRIGERYFMEKLVDGDQAANNGGWQWAAGTGTDAQPFFRIFNPVAQGQKFDPEGAYLRRWIPELAKVPNAQIHTPWKLTESERRYLGCTEYPAPIVDHAVQRQKALSLYGKVREAKTS